ncbi:MAG: hypothetical protein J5857_03160 [Treponema sp.]|nr:hypothetical protein [Treponema sp.]
MGLFADKLTNTEIGLTIRNWREEGTLEENMKNLAYRIASGEKIGEIPDAIYLLGKRIKLAEFYETVSDVVEIIEREEEKERAEIEEIDEMIKELENTETDDHSSDDDDFDSIFDSDDDDDIDSIFGED